jgi:hypothetical protein
VCKFENSHTLLNNDTASARRVPRSWRGRCHDETSIQLPREFCRDGREVSPRFTRTASLSPAVACYFCGEEFFQHALVFDRSSLTRWRQRMGEEKLKALLQESLAVATLRWPRQARACTR